MAPKPGSIAGIPFSRLSELLVSHVPDEHLASLDSLISLLGNETGELSEERSLSFLAELYLCEKMKGKKADAGTLEKIEAIVISANSFGMPKKYPTAGGGGGGVQQKHHHSKFKAFTEKAMGAIAEKSSDIYHRIPSKRKEEYAEILRKLNLPETTENIALLAKYARAYAKYSLGDTDFDLIPACSRAIGEEGFKKTINALSKCVQKLKNTSSYELIKAFKACGNALNRPSDISEVFKILETQREKRFLQPDLYWRAESISDIKHLFSSQNELKEIFLCIAPIRSAFGDTYREDVYKILKVAAENSTSLEDFKNWVRIFQAGVNEKKLYGNLHMYSIANFLRNVSKALAPLISSPRQLREIALLAEECVPRIKGDYDFKQIETIFTVAFPMLGELAKKPNYIAKMRELVVATKGSVNPAHALFWLAIIKDAVKKPEDILRAKGHIEKINSLMDIGNACSCSSSFDDYIAIFGGTGSLESLGSLLSVYESALEKGILCRSGKARIEGNSVIGNTGKVFYSGIKRNGEFFTFEGKKYRFEQQGDMLSLYHIPRQNDLLGLRIFAALNWLENASLGDFSRLFLADTKAYSYIKVPGALKRALAWLFERGLVHTERDFAEAYILLRSLPTGEYEENNPIYKVPELSCIKTIADLETAYNAFTPFNTLNSKGFFMECEKNGAFSDIDGFVALCGRLNSNTGGLSMQNRKIVRDYAIQHWVELPFLSAEDRAKPEYAISNILGYFLDGRSPPSNFAEAPSADTQVPVHPGADLLARLNARISDHPPFPSYENFEAIANHLIAQGVLNSFASFKELSWQIYNAKAGDSAFYDYIRPEGCLGSGKLDALLAHADIHSFSDFGNYAAAMSGADPLEINAISKDDITLLLSKANQLSPNELSHALLACSKIVRITSRQNALVAIGNIGASHGWKTASAVASAVADKDPASKIASMPKELKPLAREAFNSAFATKLGQYENEQAAKADAVSVAETLAFVAYKAQSTLRRVSEETGKPCVSVYILSTGFGLRAPTPSMRQFDNQYAMDGQLLNRAFSEKFPSAGAGISGKEKTRRLKKAFLAEVSALQTAGLEGIDAKADRMHASLTVASEWMGRGLLKSYVYQTAYKVASGAGGIKDGSEEAAITDRIAGVALPLNCPIAIVDHSTIRTASHTTVANSRVQNSALGRAIAQVATRIAQKNPQAEGGIGWLTRINNWSVGAMLSEVQAPKVIGFNLYDGIEYKSVGGQRKADWLPTDDKAFFVGRAWTSATRSEPENLVSTYMDESYAVKRFDMSKEYWSAFSEKYGELESQNRLEWAKNLKNVVLFDVDGTIIRTDTEKGFEAGLKKGLALISSRLAAAGIQRSEEELRAEYGEVRAKSRETLYSYGRYRDMEMRFFSLLTHAISSTAPDNSIVSQARDIAKEAYGEYIRTRNEATQIYPGAIACIEQLIKQGHDIVLMTDRRDSELYNILQMEVEMGDGSKAKLKDLIKGAIITNDLISEKETDIPICRLGLPKEDEAYARISNAIHPVLMVGDSKSHDKRPAEKNGIRAVLVGHGHGFSQVFEALRQA